MKRYERIVSIIMLTVIGLSNVATPVAYAAQLGKIHLHLPAASSWDTGGLTSVPHFFITDQSRSVLGATTSLFTIGTQKLDLGGGNALSAHPRIPLQVEKLEKKVYETTEDVALTVVNPDNDVFTTSVKDSDGATVGLPITESNNGTTTTVDLQPSNQIKPGLYKVTVTDSTNHSTEQDFRWGVLALNMDKSMYHPNEKADIAMAILNDKGDMVCDAHVELRIKNSELGIDDTLSTTNASSAENQIFVNPQCQKHDYSLEPDYEAHYTFGGAGTYTMQLTATTSNGTHSISDSIQVTERIPFDLQRVSATRIYPPNTYPMIFNITANRDFNGTVTETVPDSFTITPATQSAAQSYTAMETVYLNSTDPAAKMSQQIASASGGLVMPFHGNYSITQGFGAQLTDPNLQAFYTQYGLAGHDGIDFGVPMNTPLYAVDDGTVIWSGPGDYGTMVTIQHSWGETYYGHMTNTSVTVGQHVLKGQLIGYSGMSGEATGPHLHFGMKPKNPDMQNGYYGKIDPMPFLPIGQGESISSLDTSGGSTNTLASAIPASSTVLGASDSADANSVSPTQIPSESPSVIPTAVPTLAVSPTAIPTATPVASEAATQTISATPTPTPIPSVFASPNITGANTKFTVLDQQIRLSEEIANNALTQSVKIITWKVKLKKGESTTLGYAYQAPKVSPQFYLLGPAKFYAGGNDRLVFQEQRQWQIASDDVGVDWYTNTSANPNNGYSWQYRKKLSINAAQVSVATTSATLSYPTVTFMDSGGDATEDTTSELGFWTSSTGSPTVDSGVGNQETGPDSLKFNTGGGSTISEIWKNGTLSDPGSRTSQYIKISNYPSSTAPVICACTTGGASAVLQVSLSSTGQLSVTNNALNSIATGSTLSTGTWYRIAFSYVVSSTTNYSFKVYVNGVLDMNYSQASGGTALNATGSNTYDIGWGLNSLGANKIINFDDMYVDSGTDLSDPGNVHVTAKIPNGDDGSNNFTLVGTAAGPSCFLGNGGSSTTHCQYVDERPLSTANVLQGPRTANNESFALQPPSAGDVNISSDNYIADEAWIYAEIASGSTTCTTPTIHNDGTATTISLTTSYAMYTNIINKSSYPSYDGSLGMGTCGDASGTHTVNLAEAGMQIAYIAPTSGSLTNFPVLVSLTSDSNLNAHAQSSGNDIIFTDSTGRNLLPFEIEKYSSGTLVAWVNISSLSSTNNTIIYMYFGNPATSSLANAPNTWNSNYIAVWHLGNSPVNGSATELDSTSHGINGTPNNTGGGVAMVAANKVNAEIGSGVCVNDSSCKNGGTTGTGQIINFGDITATHSLVNVSESAWVKAPGGVSETGTQETSSDNAGLDIENFGNSNNDGIVGDNTNNEGGGTSTTFVNDGNWHDYTLTFDANQTGFTNKFKFYIDGVQQSVVNFGTLPASLYTSTTNGFNIGWDLNDNTYDDQLDDEVRLSNITLPQGWITTEYNNQNSPSSFYSLGSVETAIYAPTLSQLMAHGDWFNSQGVKQPFAF